MLQKKRKSFCESSVNEFDGRLSRNISWMFSRG